MNVEFGEIEREMGCVDSFFLFSVGFKFCSMFQVPTRNRSVVNSISLSYNFTRLIFL